MLLTGLVVLCGSVVASAFAPNIEILLALRVLTGMAGGTLPPTAVGVVSDVISPARRAQAVTAILALQGVVSATTVPLVAVIADLGGWRLPFMVSGLVLALALLMNWIWFPRDSGERARNREFFSRYRWLLSLRFFRVAIAVGVTQRIAFWATLSFFPAYLILTYEVSVGFVALPLVITAVGQVIGSYSAAYVAKQRYRAVLIAGTSVAGGVCVLLLFSSDPGIWLSVAVATVGTGLLSVAMPTLVAASTEYSGESKAYGRQSHGLEQPARRSAGGRVRGRAAGEHGLPGNGLPDPWSDDCLRILTSLFGRQFGEAAGRAGQG